VRATTKKMSSTFFYQKSAPPDKILATPMLPMVIYLTVDSEWFQPIMSESLGPPSHNTRVYAVCYSIGVARGCSGCTCTPQGGEKNLGVIYRENL